MYIIQEIFYGIGKSVCHQQLARSSTVGGLQLPFCARCMGIYLGFFFVFLFLEKWKKNHGNGPSRWQNHIVWIVCLIPLAVDGIMGTLGIWASSPAVRFGTGVLFAAGLGVHIILVKHYDADAQHFEPVIKQKEFFFTIFIITASYYSLWRLDNRLGWFLLSLFSSMGLFFTVNYALLIIIKITGKDIIKQYIWILSVLILYSMSTIHGGLVGG